MYQLSRTWLSKFLGMALGMVEQKMDGEMKRCLQTGGTRDLYMAETGKTKCKVGLASNGNSHSVEQRTCLVTAINGTKSSSSGHSKTQ